jgi:MoxR-like ATPase
MDFPFYKIDSTPSQIPAELPTSPPTVAQNFENYLPDEGLVHAVNVALLLGQPLLLTGEPGVGKTQLAYHLAWQLGLGKPLEFFAKSTSAARDLLYSYDTLGRFHAAQMKKDIQAEDYFTLNALGLAIVLASPKEYIKEHLPFLIDTVFYKEPQRSIVLIDGIDKAPDDFANDILDPIEAMYLQIYELGNVTIRADAKVRPIVVITSNLKKTLPETFLRHCTYYHIPFPEKPQLARVISKHLGEFANQHSYFLAKTLNLFYEFRNNLHKKPSIGELLNWLVILRKLFATELTDNKNPLPHHPERTLNTLSCLVKTIEDYQRAQDILQHWCKKERS